MALHTLDVSVDLDYLTASISSYDAEKFDDIDSISEFIIERIFNDDNLFAEKDNDDQRKPCKHINGFSFIVLYSNRKEDIDIKPILRSATSIRPALRNTRFQFEDHSYSDYNPPDFLAIHKFNS